MALQLDTVFVVVNDIDRSLDWYSKIGLEPGPRYGAWQTIVVDGATRFALHEGERPQGHSTAVPSFLVEDLDAEIRRLAELEISPTDAQITDVGEARFITFTDPDGNQIQLLER